MSSVLPPACSRRDIAGAVALRDESRAPRVVLFTGGRGSTTLARQLLKDRRVRLTLAINGYDDGASTGEVRRFLGDSLGPSDFRKNASRLASELGTCGQPLIDMLDARLPNGLSRQQALDAAARRVAAWTSASALLRRFLLELSESSQDFSFDDCCIGNLVFAGAFLSSGRTFNAAIDSYCAMLGLPPGAIENVTSGENAYLVAIAEDDTLLGSEEEIVDAAQRLRVREIFLVDRPLSASDRVALARMDPDDQSAFLEGRRANVSLNSRLGATLAAADLIVYAPGTQHSSLFPSYLTPGLADVIAANLGALKVLITNLHADAEMPDASAADIIERALFYMNGKGERQRPTPSLITHYVVNDPQDHSGPQGYVRPGPLDARDDLPAIRIANYEEGASGRHDAAKSLEPFLQTLIGQRRSRVAVVFEHAASANTIAQALVEATRGGIAALELDVTVLYVGAPLDGDFLLTLPFMVRCFGADEALGEGLVAERPDYVLLFEASGMYRGEDIVAVARGLVDGRFDAVWGSRRLSVREINESIRFRYERSPLGGALSRAGSQLLSLACLTLFGRYVSDTLSGVRAVRRSDATALGVPLGNPRINQHLLGRLLGRKADLVEVPVRFFPLSPERVRRTTVLDGVSALAILIAHTFHHGEDQPRTLPNIHKEHHA